MTTTKQRTLCTHCHASFRVSKSLEGRKAKCPNCDKSFLVQMIDRDASSSDDESSKNVGQVDAPETQVRKVGDTAHDDDNSNTEPDTEPDKKPSRSADLNSPPSKLPCLVDRYQLTKRLGRGGFGEVWEATDLSLDRQVAIKLAIFPASDQKRARRFLTEGRAAARLGHPSIAAVYDAGKIDQQYYLAVELIDGGDLDKVARQRESKLPHFECASMIKQLAEALNYAHGESILHRDIKPQNIVITSQGIPKIIDFGLAKILEDQSGQTVDGTIMGTPAFMAPEQARGAVSEIGPHTDQYSLGVTLYWLLTGVKPFEGPYAAIIVQVIESEPQKLSLLCPNLDPRLAAICEKAMAKHPKDRYATCGEFADDLDRFLRDEDVLAKPTSKIRKVIRLAMANKIVGSLLTIAMIVLATGFMVGLVGMGNASIQTQLAEKLGRELDQEWQQQQDIQSQSEKSLAESQQALERTVKAQAIAEEKQKSNAAINANLSEQLAANEKLLQENQELQKKIAPAVAKLEAELRRASEVDQYKKTLLEESHQSFSSDPKQNLVIYQTLHSKLELEKPTPDKMLEYRGKLWECQKILETMPIENRDLRWQLFATVVDIFPRKLVPIPMPDTGLAANDKRVEAVFRLVGVEAKKSELFLILEEHRFPISFQRDMLRFKYLNLQRKPIKGVPLDLATPIYDPGSGSNSVVIEAYSQRLDFIHDQRRLSVELISEFSQTVQTRWKLRSLGMEISNLFDLVEDAHPRTNLRELVRSKWKPDVEAVSGKKLDSLIEKMNRIPSSQRDLIWRVLATKIRNESNWLNVSACQLTDLELVSGSEVDYWHGDGSLLARDISFPRRSQRFGGDLGVNIPRHEELDSSWIVSRDGIFKFAYEKGKKLTLFKLEIGDTGDL